MNSILIVMWFAVNQSYLRNTEYYPQVQMQAFQSRKACEAAASTIKRMANGKKVETVCVDSAI